MSADSSSDEDNAMFAAVAVSADDLSKSAERSKQLAAQRQARARQRRAGGGGILGVVPSDDRGGGGSGDEVEQESVFLDAAQLKVADALQARLAQELEEVPAAPPPAPAPTAGAAEDSEPSTGVRLFRRVKAGAPLVERPQQAAQPAANKQQQELQGSGAPGDAAAMPGSSGPAAKRWLDEPTKKRCKAAAVEAATIEAAAAGAAQQAASNIASPPGWLPADDDPSRWSHRRKRRAAKLAAEAAAWQARRQAAQG